MACQGQEVGSVSCACLECLELCLVASWSDALLLHLELARSDSDASRLRLRCLPSRCSQQACWSVLVFPPSRPVIAGGAVFCQQQLMFFVSRRADASLEPGLPGPHREEKRGQSACSGFLVSLSWSGLRVCWSAEGSLQESRKKNAASVSLVFGPVLCGVCQRDVVRLHALPPDQAHAATASCVDVSPVHSLQQQVMCMVCRTVRGSSQENPSVLGPKWPIREGGVICWQPCCVCMSAEKSEQ